jgi:hypothetical protein
MATTTEQRNRATAGKKAAATRKRNASKRSQAARRAAATRADAEKTYLEALAIQAEKAVLIPVGAALVARDSLVETAKGFQSRTGVERELKRFERRGNTARNRTLRELKRSRTQVEREIRKRRTQATRLVKRNRRQVEQQVKRTRRDFERNATNLQNGAEKLVDRVQEQVTTVA